MKKSILCLFLLFTFLLSAIPAFAESPTGGVCGENLTWTLEDGVLTISGTGEMTKFTDAPWYAMCDTIHTVIIEDGVTSISDSAFYYCSNLTNISLPNGITSIEEGAFFCCSSLTSIYIPESVTFIGEYVFSTCANLTDITVDPANQSYSSIDGVLFNKNKTELIQFPAKKEECVYIVPDSVTSISASAFYECTGLKSIRIPDRITSINAHTFSNCSNLTNINIPDGVTSIDYASFWRCTNLTNIYLPDSLTSIASHAFTGCTNLTNITIPNSVTYIGPSAFGYNALTDVYYTGTPEEWEAIDCNDQTIANLPPEAIHFNAADLFCAVSGGEDILYQPDNTQQYVQLDIVITNLSADETVDELSKTLDKTAQNVIVNITLPDGFSFAPDTDVRTKGYAFTSLANSGQISETVYLRNPPAGVSSAKINVTCDNANTMTLFHDFSVNA